MHQCKWSITTEVACVLPPRFEAGGFKFEGTPLEHQVLPEEWLRDWTRNLTTILSYLKVRQGTQLSR